MKRTAFILLILALCISLCACDSSEYNEAMDLLNEGNYESALVIFESLDDYKSSAEFAKKCNYELGMEQYDKGNYSAAIVYFEALGEYKDSADLVVRIGNQSKYDEAVSLFGKGTFDEALAIFSQLPADFEDTSKYILAIDHLEVIAGTWATESYLSEKNDRGDVALSATLTISAPFSISSSGFSDCDWGIFANIKLDVDQVWIGSAMTSSGGKQAKFTITSRELASHISTDAEDKLSTSFLIKNTNAYQTVFDSRYGAYSKIWIFPETQSDGTMRLELIEIPYSSNWSTEYGDGGFMYLYKEN